jgi:hypothetical protein
MYTDFWVKVVAEKDKAALAKLAHLIFLFYHVVKTKIQP